MAFDSLSEKLGNIFKKLRSRGKLSEADVKEVMREIRMALLSADVNYKVAKDFVAQVSERALGADVLESLTPAQQVIKIVNEELTSFMGGENDKIRFSSKPPTVVMLCGLQGAGKTTHAAKFALYFKNMGKRPLLVACDIYRPAAILQLQVMGEKAGVPVFTMPEGTDPVTIAKNAVSYAKDHGYDMVFIDTAGRLHIDEILMTELRNIKAAVEPREIILTVDAMTGQDAVNVAKSFDEALDITGVLLTKTDGDTRGGAALSVKYVTGKPIKFIGTGEKLGDIEPFHPDRMASRILGMGDVLSLIEKAEQSYDEKKARALEEKIRENKMDLNDFLDNMRQLKNMGPLEQIIGMLPGVNKQALRGAEIDEKQISHTEAIILSMTGHERENPEIINASRKKRIAAGCGLRVEDVNRLLKSFEQMKTMMKRVPGFSSVARRATKKKRKKKK
ncbi:MAG: signal recognition particle protein [Clostridiales bacterium]|nr:signal recognition particle protein [Clostridiales bacterium]